MKSIIYLDASSTTPITNDVIELMVRVQQDYWGNPSNIHAIGIKASQLLEDCRMSIARILDADYEDIVFTSGATESINTCILGSAFTMDPARIVISSVEHPAVLAATDSLKKLGWVIDYWPVDNKGNIDLNFMDKLLDHPTKIVSIIWGQSEIGTIQPIELIGKECLKRNIIFHTDASQYISNCPISWKNLTVDYLSLSAHKFRGPRGIGLLLRNSKRPIEFFPIIRGGGQEGGFRSGTESVHLIAGLDLALKNLYKFKFNNNKPLIEKDNNIKDLTLQLRNKISSLKNIYFTGDPYNRLSNHISLLLSDDHNNPINSSFVVLELSKLGVYVSSGSACNSSSVKGSHVLKAININPKWHKSALRLSLGDWLTKDEINMVPNFLEQVISNL